MNKKNRNYSIIGGFIILIAVVLIANPDVEELDLTKVSVSGTVKTVGLETEPFKIDFVNEVSKKRLTTTLDQNKQFSTTLTNGTYKIEVFYTTFADVATLSCTAGVFNIDSDMDDLNIQC